MPYGHLISQQRGQIKRFYLQHFFCKSSLNHFVSAKSSMNRAVEARTPGNIQKYICNVFQLYKFSKKVVMIQNDRNNVQDDFLSPKLSLKVNDGGSTPLTKTSPILVVAVHL